jgi:hypothetical protein
MRYMLLIHADEKDDLSPGDPGFDEMMKGYRALSEELRAKGAMVHGDPLQPVATATSLRYGADRLVMTDGPYAETREQLGGYYLIECSTKEEAIAYAAKIPGAERGAVEVRQLFGHDPRVFPDGEGHGYMLLIYGDEANFLPSGSPELAAGIARHQALTARAIAAGAYVAGDALYPVAMTATVKVRDGKTLVTDGPFAETREQLGGFYGLRCRDLDQALDYAKELAEVSARTSGCIEVRPVANYG